MTRLAGLAQVVAAVFWMATAFYCLLASQTFAFEQFLKPELLPQLAAWARGHQIVTVVVLAIYVTCHWRAGTLRERRTRTACLAVIGVWTVAAAVMAAAPPLAALAPGSAANAMAILALGPVLLVAAVDLAAAPSVGDAVPMPRHAADFASCVTAAFAATGISAAVTISRAAPVALSSSATGITGSLLLHLALFAAIFLALTAARAAGAALRSRRAEAWLATVLMAGGFFLFLGRSVILTLVADTTQGTILGLAWAATLAVLIAARGLRVSRAGDDPVVRVTLALSPRMAAGGAGLAAWLVAIAAATWLVARASATADWNFAVANAGVAALWTVALATGLRVVRLSSPGRPVAFVAATAVVLATNVAWTRAAGHAPSGDSPLADAAWTRVDPAARFLADTVRPRTVATDGALFALLQLHTNIPTSIGVTPVDISLGTAGGVQPYRPHIFLFVVDSMRRDYLGAYNPAATFTPNLDAFANENVAFRRAFTRYGATGLAVPSIWTGGMLLHQQYTRPFAPMNTLAKLLADQQYEQWIGMDHIMDTILPVSARRQPLDTARTVKDFRWCRTLDEVRARLASRPATGDPLFVYSLPQDIHVSAVAREGGAAVDEGAYPGFSAPVASRMKAFDACFGAFVADLKARGLYDDSVVIVTADHGDSLGEDGRFGHAYTLYPEVIRIPLLVHLPVRLAAGLEAENDGTVFSTDITPTLHALLGATPARPRSFFGRPLFRARGQQPRRGDAEAPVIAASYGAVYGALLEGGRTLYVLDTINVREEAFALDEGVTASPQRLTDAVREEGRQAIRTTVEDVADFYRFRPQP